MALQNKIFLSFKIYKSHAIFFPSNLLAIHAILFIIVLMSSFSNSMVVVLMMVVSYSTERVQSAGHNSVGPESRVVFLENMKNTENDVILKGFMDEVYIII